jgi:uncharacterized coiled-coil protein SlyX
MKEQIEQRLLELKNEFTVGQKTLADLEARAANLRETLLRISGAIQVLQEELAKSHPETSDEIESSEKVVEMQ